MDEKTLEKMKKSYVNILMELVICAHWEELMTRKNFLVIVLCGLVQKIYI